MPEEQPMSRSNSTEPWTDPVSEAAKQAAADWRAGIDIRGNTRREFARRRGVEFWQLRRALHRLTMARYHAQVRRPRQDP
jgi:hypothetical protein